jgi:hypothetical protein
MGMTRIGPPVELLREIGNRFRVEKFIETGTFRGNTAVWAGSVYKSVVSIENSLPLYEAAKTKYGDAKNIEFVLGHSAEKLKEIVARLAEPCVFWLDAHWSGGDTYGEGDECPIVEEIEAINCSSHDHFVLIDDARLFMAPPPPPHDPRKWPTILQLLEALSQRSRYTVIIQDVIVAVPESARSTVMEYCQRKAAHEWKRDGGAIRRGMRKLAGFLNGTPW